MLLCYLTSSLPFQPNQDAKDNFNAVDLSWLKRTTDPLKVLRHSLAFLQDPSKIDESNREVWCNLHITPALEGIVVVCSLEEVIHWAKKGAWGLLQTPQSPELPT